MWGTIGNVARIAGKYLFKTLLAVLPGVVKMGADKLLAWIESQKKE